MTKKQALSILKPENNSFSALKQAFHKACFQHHPDHGGDVEIMKLVNEAYQLLNACEWTVDEQTEADKEVPLTETLREVLNKIKHFPGIVPEIIGSWLWVTGNTYTYKKEIKEAGFAFSNNKKAWYFHEGGYRKKNGKFHSLPEIRSKFGSQETRTEEHAAIM